ncbi:hypothetical protein O6379_24175, partial [Salmonella enterica subsp. enterica]|uniref:hypothetical protein n=1 Tax=Salmonella enterica TaxID=28901 RepID=UPI0022B689A4|nr:hypothetical protein [Salmonella enterica]
RVAEDSFRKLFSLLRITIAENVAEYLRAFKQRQIYNVRMLLQSVSGLTSHAAVRNRLQSLGISRSNHADRLAPFFFGEYRALEEELMQQ